MAKLSPKVYTWLCGLFASLGSIIFGYDLGVIAGVTPASDFQRVMGPKWGNTNLQGLVVSIFVLGCFFGMIPVAYAADFFGRRVTIQLGAAIYIFGGAIQTGAQNMSMMLAGRFFAGYGVGIMSDLAPLYQAEIAHPSIRGRLTTLQQFMLGIGAFVASWVTYGCSAGLSGRPSEWRVPLGIQIIPALPLISFMLLLPESPRWLAEKGRMTEARATLARLHANGDIDDPFVISQIKDIEADIAKSQDVGEASWSELFTVSSNFRRLSLGYILQFSVQMTGVSAIQYYSTTIFKTMGFSSTRILLFQSVNSIIALLGEAACVIWIDATGRRGPMIIGNVVSGLSFVVGSILMARFPGTVNNNAAHYVSRFLVNSYAVLTNSADLYSDVRPYSISNSTVLILTSSDHTSTWVFNFFFSACIGPLSWAYPAEIYSTRTRAKATAITSSGSWISNFFIAQVTSPAFQNIGWKFYLVFAICGHTNALFIWAFYPETTGRRLEEMDALFENAPLFVPGTRYAKVGDHRAAERELRQGTFRPGDLTEHNIPAQDEEDGKGSTEKME
ncbi:MFS domain-containing protein [Mycena sanguinolenta]|uniref:MFS domain-containing protein n=1 Tax=Mycena sanguinolenta TaxID=230812 RepID=A0A8H7CMN4_9AGAR|nr:MFS domain-containing protein [Mycena sanguinolenta]